ncbi:MAG: ATP-binding protein [Coriobacteriia bacterium]|nr:ATP-binding protein [Coriobacteriia bacterium]
MISRPLYENKLIGAQNPEVVKVLTGVRRCGKSSLLRLLGDHLINSGVPKNNIISINFEYPTLNDLQTAANFYEYVKQRLPQSGPAFLFVDEVQELEAWAKVINGIRAEFEVDIFVTGSNSRMFAGEHMTYLSGRYIPIEVYPLSLAEYSVFKGNVSPVTSGKESITASTTSEHEGLYTEYVRLGAFPAVALARDTDFAQSILDGLYDSVYSRDILLRGKIKNEAAFLRVASFVFENIGSQISAHAVANTLKSTGHKISSETVDNYLGLMGNAFLIYPCACYDIRGKERLRTNGKYYVVDPGLRNRVLGFRSSNHGHVAENMVFLELKRRGFEVNVGRIANTELDFIAQSHEQRFYIQVSETVLDPAVLERETAPFRKLNDGYPRVLITKDRADYSVEGVRHLNFYDFLFGCGL